MLWYILPVLFLIILLFIIICIVICLYIKKYYQEKMSQVYQDLLQKLDRAAAGEIQPEIYDESLDAAVTTRLDRIVQIQGMDKERAEKERDAVKSLISDISHQVRTPLANIILYTELLKEKTTNKDSSHLLEKIQKQSGKLDFFIRELVKSSYTEQEIISVHPELIKATEIVNPACQAVENATLGKGIVIVKELTDSYCYADKRWSTEAVSNVLENAVKYSPPESVIMIKVIPYGYFTCIQVSDNGIGISEKEQGLVYERFYRSEDVRNQPGFGIGLYLVREILSKQSGYSRIKSEKGKGTTMQIFLPDHVI